MSLTELDQALAEIFRAWDEDFPASAHPELALIWAKELGPKVLPDLFERMKRAKTIGDDGDDTMFAAQALLTAFAEASPEETRTYLAESALPGLELEIRQAMADVKKTRS